MKKGQTEKAFTNSPSGSSDSADSVYLGDPDDVLFLCFLESLVDEAVLSALETLTYDARIAQFFLNLPEEQRLHLAEALSGLRFAVAVEPQAAVDYQNFRRAMVHMAQFMETEEALLLF